MHFERTDNATLVTLVLSHPKIYDAIADDSCPPRRAFAFQPKSNIWAVAVRDEGELLGVFLFEPRNAVEWIVHTCLLPSAWGPRAHAAAKGVIEWIWQNTTCRRINTHVPEYNHLALRFAKQAGLIEYGRNPQSWLKNGKLWGQIELGISKES